MKKELITVDNVNNYISKQDGKLYVFGNRLLTAGAKEVKLATLAVASHDKR